MEVKHPSRVVGRTRFRRDRDPVSRVRPSFYLVDVLASAFGILALVEHFRARAAYSSAPLFGFVLPILFLVFSSAYRRRAVGWARAEWSRIESYSRTGGPIPWVGVWSFAFVPAWLIGLSNERTLGAVDTRPVIPTAVSLITQGNLDLREYLDPAAGRKGLLDRNGQVRLNVRVLPGGVYSNYPAGMVPFAVAVVGLSAALDARLDQFEVHRHLEKMTAAIVSALSIGIYFLIALRLAPASSALVSTAILAFGSGIFSTVSMALWQHGGIIFWSLLILFLEFRESEKTSRWHVGLQGFACAQLVSCRLTSVSFLIPLGLWVSYRDPRRALALVGFSVLAYLPWAWAYWTTYGNVFGPSLGVISGGLWSIDLTEPLAGLLFSPARGLLVYQPWLLIFLTLLIPSFRARMSDAGGSRGPTGWVPFCAAAIVGHIFLVASWGCWWGGWCWGSRLLVDIVPLAALLCLRPMAALVSCRTGRILVVTLGLLGVVAQVPFNYFHAERWNAIARFPDDVWSLTHSPLSEWHLGP